MARTRQVAVILDSTSAYQRKMLLGIGAYSREGANWGLYMEDQPAEKLPDLKSWRGDGLILSFVNRNIVKAVRDLRLPMVGIEGQAGWYDPASSIPYFASDNRAIGRLGAEHLIEQGFVRLAYCGYPPTRLTPWSSERAEAFAERAQQAGLPCAVYRGRHTTARQWGDLQHELAAWLESLEKPVGLLAANDARARHVLEASRTVGLRVPEDVAVLGVDNDEIVCELATPALSSIEQGARSLGYLAAALLDKVMAGKQAKGGLPTCGARKGRHATFNQHSRHPGRRRGGGGRLHSGACLRSGLGERRRQRRTGVAFHAADPFQSDHETHDSRGNPAGSARTGAGLDCDDRPAAETGRHHGGIRPRALHDHRFSPADALDSRRVSPPLAAARQFT